MEKITSALRRLDLSAPQQDVYLSLLRQGKATARTIAARTAITRPSVYDQLKSLIVLNLVVELDIEGKAYFAAADIKYLDALLADKIDRLEQSRAFLAEELPTLIGSLDTVTPKVRFFEGHEGMKQLLKDIMWHDKTTLEMVVVSDELQKVFDAAFLNWFNERRLMRKLVIKALYVGMSAKNKQLLFSGGTADKAVSVPVKAAAGVSMSYIVYDSKVAFISSAKESFGFIVESADFATLQRLQFSALWSTAK